MKKDLNDIRIVFMGTPEFAVPSLDELVANGCNIVAVVTAPDKAAGRGMNLNESAIKTSASQKGLPLLQPIRLKDQQFISELKSFNADLQIIVAFRMLPEVVWNMPPMGSINVHASLLPQYRGAAPINWAIINGEKETGLTTFRLRHEIDTGNILLQQKIPIRDDETAGELHDKMKIAGAKLLMTTISGMASGTLQEVEQSPDNSSEQNLKYAPKISTETCKIDWNKSVTDIYNLVRGLSPFPGAFTSMEGKLLKIFKCHKENAIHSAPVGQLDSNKKTFIRFACKDGFIYPTDVQLEGKKRMPIGEFLRGYRFREK